MGSSFLIWILLGVIAAVLGYYYELKYEGTKNQDYVWLVLLGPCLLICVFIYMHAMIGAIPYADIHKT
jgi:hypothetical protein